MFVLIKRELKHGSGVGEIRSKRAAAAAAIALIVALIVAARWRTHERAAVDRVALKRAAAVVILRVDAVTQSTHCLLYTSPSPRD